MSVNTTTGVINDDLEQALADANLRIDTLNDSLSRVNRELTKLMEDHRAVAEEFSARYNAYIASSKLGSDDRRKAEAETLLRKEYLPGDDMSIAARKGLLEMQIRIKRDTGHDIRSVLSSLQTKSSNIRAAMQAQMQLASYGGQP